MPKNRLRQFMLTGRKSLSAEERRIAALAVQRSFIATYEFASAQVVALYSPIHGEVDTLEVMRVAGETGKSVLYPVVSGDGLIFRKVEDASKLCKGAFGILEPSSGSVVSPDEAGAIVVPGVAFDLSGRRIGYGKGYYDRVLHRLEGKGKLVGFCFDFQVVEEIAAEPHDVVMDLIITETRVIRPRDYHIQKEVTEH